VASGKTKASNMGKDAFFLSIVHQKFLAARRRAAKQLTKASDRKIQGAFFILSNKKGPLGKIFIKKETQKCLTVK